MEQKNMQDDIRNALLNLAETLSDALDGRDKLTAKAALSAARINHVIQHFDFDFLEKLSDQDILEVNEYLSLVYGGLVEFLRQKGVRI